MTWQTTSETSTLGFNVIRTVKGQRIQLNAALIQCQACGDGRPGSYSFIVPKHKNASAFSVELVRTDGVDTYLVSR